jgi:hypothetical protein
MTMGCINMENQCVWCLGKRFCTEETKTCNDEDARTICEDMRDLMDSEDLFNTFMGVEE